MMIRDLPQGEQPVYRLGRYGAKTLSLPELINAVIQSHDTELGYKIAAQFGFEGLARASVEELCNVPGIGPTKAAQLKAAVELGRRLIALPGGDAPTIKSPADAAYLLMADMGQLDQEEMRVIHMDPRCRVISTVMVYRGNVNTIVMRPAELLMGAVKINASRVIIAHNHPSGDPTPSPEDVEQTRQIIQAGKLLCIEVVDHIVIGGQRFISMNERGLAFD